MEESPDGKKKREVQEMPKSLQLDKRDSRTTKDALSNKLTADGGANKNKNEIENNNNNLDDGNPNGNGNPPISPAKVIPSAETKKNQNSSCRCDIF